MALNQNRRISSDMRPIVQKASAYYGANSVWPVNNKKMAIIQNIKKDEERIKDIIGITFFSVFFTIPNIDNMIPIPVRKNVI